MAIEDSVAQDQLRAIIERAERLNEEKDALNADLAEIFKEAKANGFCTKTIKKIISIRRQDHNERMEAEAILDLYLEALGMIDATRAAAREAA